MYLFPLLSVTLNLPLRKCVVNFFSVTGLSVSKRIMKAAFSPPQGADSTPETVSAYGPRGIGSFRAKEREEESPQPVNQTASRVAVKTRAGLVNPRRHSPLSGLEAAQQHAGLLMVFFPLLNISGVRPRTTANISVEYQLVEMNNQRVVYPPV